MTACRALACAVLVPLWLAACAPMTRTVSGGFGEAPVFTNAETRVVLSLLDGYQRWQAMPAEDLRLEFTAANDAYATAQGDAERLRLALLLSLPGAPFRDDGRALSVLEPVATPGAAGPLRELALIVRSQLAERLRAVRDEQKRSEELSQKLDALRKLERSLIEREQRARPK